MLLNWFGCGRKDIYGVYAEPVDPEEVFFLFMLILSKCCLEGFFL